MCNVYGVYLQLNSTHICLIINKRPRLHFSLTAINFFLCNIELNK